MIRRLADIDPRLVGALSPEALDWGKGRNLDQARAILNKLLAEHDA